MLLTLVEGLAAVLFMIVVLLLGFIALIRFGLSADE